MNKIDTPLKCFIAVVKNKEIAPPLQKIGFSRSLLIFAVPDYGIVFRCRAEGSPIDLEFMAFFSLLEFLKNNLKEEKIKSLLIISSEPEFVFSFQKNSVHLAKGSAKRKLLNEFSHHFQIAVGYIEPINNKAFQPPTEYPSLPQGISLKLADYDDKFGKQSFRPFMRGVRL